MGGNADAARRVYDAFGRGDIAAVLAAFDEKIDWQEPDGLPFGPQVGPQAVVENVFSPVLDQIKDFRVDVRELVDGGEGIVCSIGTYRGVGMETAEDLDAEFVHVLRFGA